MGLPDNSMLEGDASEIVATSLETFWLVDPKKLPCPLKEPEAIFREWAIQRGEQT